MSSLGSWFVAPTSLLPGFMFSIPTSDDLSRKGTCTSLEADVPATAPASGVHLPPSCLRPQRSSRFGSSCFGARKAGLSMTRTTSLQEKVKQGKARHTSRGPHMFWQRRSMVWKSSEADNPGATKASEEHTSAETGAMAAARPASRGPHTFWQRRSKLWEGGSPLEYWLASGTGSPLEHNPGATKANEETSWPRWEHTSAESATMAAAWAAMNSQTASANMPDDECNAVVEAAQEAADAAAAAAEAAASEGDRETAIAVAAAQAYKVEVLQGQIEILRRSIAREESKRRTAWRWQQATQCAKEAQRLRQLQEEMEKLQRESDDSSNKAQRLERLQGDMYQERVLAKTEVQTLKERLSQQEVRAASLEADLAEERQLREAAEDHALSRGSRSSARLGYGDAAEHERRLVKSIVDLEVRAMHGLRGQSEREQVRRRILAKWHPDKNQHNPRFATQVIQDIQSRPGWGVASQGRNAI